jgi:hypothetical protein
MPNFLLSSFFSTKLIAQGGFFAWSSQTNSPASPKGALVGLIGKTTDCEKPTACDIPLQFIQSAREVRSWKFETLIQSARK